MAVEFNSYNMALIQTSAIISSIKGSIGGVTFSNVRGGIAAKKRLIGKKSINSKQLTALNTSKISNGTWKSMGFGIKEQWNDFASAYTFTDRFGVTKELTGFNWFKTINTTRVFFNQSVISIPPTYEVADAIPVFYVSMSSTSIVIDWSTPINDTLIDIMVYASAPSRSQAQYNRGKYSLLTLGSIDYSNSFDITAAWELATGLVYADIAATGLFNINVLIVPVSKLSYITGVAQSSTSQVPRSGIGWMQVGSTFIVS